MKGHSLARGIALAAFLIAVGNIASRALGLIRVSAIAYYFGIGPEVDAFTLAWTVPNTIYDLLINGAVSAALVPIFSEYAEGDEDEFWRVVTSVFSIALLALATLLALAMWQAPALIGILAQGDQNELRATATDLVRLLLPAVLLMGLSGLTTAVLYARQTFLLPAFVGAVFNAGMILGIVLFHQRLGIYSLAAGALIGALGQVFVQLPGLRGLRFLPDLRHPAVRRIMLLYAPVALGIGFSVLGTLIDRWLASGIADALSTMQYATTLIQFPLGLVATAISVAVLPTLSRQNAVEDEESFRRTLAMGLKVVLLLVIPATAGLATLATPITALLFERGAFGDADTAITALALICYLPGLPAAALDQLLIFAFYARKNTLTPNLIQGAAILCYLAVALPLLWFSELGLLALVLGNSAQWIGHALIAYLLLRRQVSFSGLRLGEATFKALLASGVMAFVVLAIVIVSAPLAWPPLLTLAIAGGSGAIVYFIISTLLRVEALDFFLAALRRKVGRA
jgi:putative peptidoglycan lipid II flippase